MKRIIAILICVMMLSALAVGTSAEGIIWKDDFSAGFSANNWILDGNNFFLDDLTDSSNPCLATYENGKVCQMEYRYDVTPTQRIFTNCDFSVKIQLRDYGIDPTDHFFGLWWRDDFLYVSDADGGDAGVEMGEIWTLVYEEIDDSFKLQVEGEEEPRVSVPANGKIELGGDWFTFGWKITPGRMCGYLNNEKIIDYSSEDISAASGSPILLLNGNYYSAWDDVTVADLDYNLFGDNNENPVTSETEGTVTTTEGGEADVTTQKETSETTTKIVEEIVTDDNGETSVVTKVETETATKAPEAPADTNVNKPVGGSSTATGDTSFVVVAVMIVALGCAVVVKNAKVR